MIEQTYLELTKNDSYENSKALDRSKINNENISILPNN